MVAATPLARVRPDGMLAVWAASLLALLLLVALPIAMLVGASLYDEGWSLAGYADFVADRRTLQAAANSLLLATGVACASLAIGTPLALGVARVNMRGKALVQGTVIVSLVSPDFLLAMAYIALAGPNAGYLNLLIRGPLRIGHGPGPLDVFSLWGLMLTALPHGVAYVFLSLAPALRNADPALDEAARLAGAKPLRAIADILLPALRPALLSGGLLAFAGSLAVFGPADLLRINVMTVSIREALRMLDFQAAAVQSVALCAVSLVALIFYRRATRQAERFQTMGGRAFAARTIKVGAAAHLFTALGAVYAILVVILPYGSMAAISLLRSVGGGLQWNNLTLDNYAAVLGNPAVQNATWRSVELAAAAAAIVVSIGLACGYVIARTRYPFRATLDGLAMLPLAIPGTAIAIALAVAYLHAPLDRLGLYGTSGILLVAYLARFIPFGVRASQTALVQLSREFEDAGRVFGSGRILTLLLIVVPILARTLLSTGLIVFILAVPELSASVILKGVDSQTFSTALLDVWNGNGGLAPACALSTSLFLVIAALLSLAALGSGKPGGRAVI